MKDKQKTKAQLIDELSNLRRRISISEKSEAEREIMPETLIHTQMMEVIEQIARGLGHELRNPLASIKNAAYILKMTLENPESEAKEALEILERNVVKSEKIIGSLLLFVRQKTPDWQTTDVDELLKKALL